MKLYYNFIPIHTKYMTLVNGNSNYQIWGLIVCFRGLVKIQSMLIVKGAMSVIFFSSTSFLAFLRCYSSECDNVKTTRCDVRYFLLYKSLGFWWHWVTLNDSASKQWLPFHFGALEFSHSNIKEIYYPATELYI